VKLSQTAEYALRAMVWLADHPGPAWAAAEVAEASRVPPKYLSKVLQTLALRGLVVARRGPGGGFLLARPPEAISVLDVVNAVDPIESIACCPLGYGTTPPHLCPLHSRLNDAVAQIEAAFRETLLSDLVKAPGCASLCERP
jgi:Rrf2 family transcriptional regulator, nitric oxide-sensitive transcriptional repressor